MGIDLTDLLDASGLWLHPEERPVFADTEFGERPAKGYKALVFGDQVMRVVSIWYRPARHSSVARVALELAMRFNPSAGVPDEPADDDTNDQAGLVCGVALGRAGEEALFAVRVASNEERTLYILATNSHGGRHAVRFRLVDVDGESGAVLVRDTPARQLTEPHQGQVERRLLQLPGTPRGCAWIPRYLAETVPDDRSLAHRRCSRGQQERLVAHLWPQDTKDRFAGDGRLLHHPRDFLLSRSLADARTSWDVYVSICAYLDRYSEAREPGDGTKDRLLRVALGAGDSIKRRAWRWLLVNT